MGYIEAAKATWALIKSGQAFQAVINDCLVDRALTVSILIGAFNTGVVCWLLAADAVVGAICGIISLVILAAMMRVVDSAVATIFVCFCESPDALAAIDFRLFTEIEAAKAQY